MNNSRTTRSLSGLMALLLFAVFAVCILSVLLSGTRLYQRLAQRDDAAYSHRTVVQYLSTKLRQSDCADTVYIEAFGDGDALVVTEDLEGELFVTRIYCCDGWLCELFSPAELEAWPEDGEQLLPLQAMELTQDGSLVTVSLTEADGSQQTFRLTLRSTQEEGL